MIVVTGAGKVGGHVVAQLHEAGEQVRVLVRDPGRAEVPPGVQVVAGDLSAPQALVPVLEGADAVFLIWPQPTATDLAAAVASIARHVGRLVYLSSSTVRDDLERQAHPMTQIHAEIERPTPEVARARLTETGSSPELADAALELWVRLVCEPEPVTPTVERISGRPPVRFADWALAHRADFA